MPDAREYPSVLADAEAAAKRGDFVTAEAWLREGLPLQEAALGAAHPDVASSLNNLAVICESTGRLDEAERLFRRAYDVASAAVAQARPGAEKILATSRENLRDFCVEHGRPFDDHGDPAWGLRDHVPAAPAAPARPAQPPPTAQPPRPVTATRTVTPPPRAAHTAPSTRPPAATFPRAIAVVAVAVLAATLGWRWLRADDAGARTPAPPGVTADSATAPIDDRPAPAPPEAPPSPPAAMEPPPAGVPEAAPPAAVAAPLEAPATVTAPPAGALPAREAPLPGAASAAPGLDAPRVMTADLCASLETGGRVWRCAPVDTPAAPGRLSFVTRIASPRGARLQHRWSREGDVRQSVRLSVAASPTEGYRTYSRQTVTPGAWSVAVLDAEGVVLQELRFEVRAP